MNEKERLLLTLKGSNVDRPPFIIPGGLVWNISNEVIERGGLAKVAFSTDPDAIGRLSMFLHDEMGMENLGLPFTMRVISEAYGGEKDSPEEIYALKHVYEYKRLKKLNPEKDGRLPVVIETIRLLSKKRGKDVPVIADITGPLSLASSLVNAKTILKAFIEDPIGVHGFLTFLTEDTIVYAERLVCSGARCVFLVDPFSTSETLGSRFFLEFALPYLNCIIESVHRMGVSVILHLCGSLEGLPISRLTADCISIDKVADKSLLHGIRIMGGITIPPSPPDPSFRWVPRKGGGLFFLEGAISEIQGNYDILSPSCGQNIDIWNLKTPFDLAFTHATGLKL